MIKWDVELSEYNISYQPRTVIKAQAFVKFMSKATLDKEDAGKWLLNIDGASTYSCNRGRVMLTSLKGDGIEFSLRFDLKVSNNEAEYETLIVGIKLALDAGARNLTVYSDSQLVTN
ncbi:UNVERIFIED_CONTAM: hypothetical protein Scaly_0590300 [Sesamum calycinum]|uniref:RNase H type-1 domain-containing protein n=1 Tax=Sesamum calycinum TaxID=2727403 RepID=A0AAW2RS18_9LAMI